jgi:hypothetical protein
MKMKNILLLSFALLVTIVAFSQDKKEKEVASAVEQLRVAMVDADSVTLMKITSDKLSYGHSGGHVEGQQEFVHKIVTGQSDFVTMELTEQTITVFDKTAIVRHNLSAKTNDNGKPGEVHLKVLLVWQLQHGKWVLIARQAVH